MPNHSIIEMNIMQSSNNVFKLRSAGMRVFNPLLSFYSYNEKFTLRIEKMASARFFHTENYQIAKLKKHLKPFLEYLEFKTEEEAKEKLFKDEEKKTVNTQKIENQTPYDLLNTVLTTVCTTAKPYIGMKSNSDKAARALKILLKTIDDCSHESHSSLAEPVVIVYALIELASVYKELPQRFYYSPAHWLCEKPKIQTAIEDIFKDYKLNPDDETLAEHAFKVFKCFH